MASATGRTRAGMFLVGALITGAVLMGASPAEASKKNDDGVHKVTICHRTNSDTNPYNVITVDFDAANGGFGKGGNDHSHHEGPAWNPTLKADHIKWGDIIPPFTYDGGSFPGLNWDDGQAIAENGCVPVPVDEGPCPNGPTEEGPCAPCPFNVPGVIYAGDPLCVDFG